MAFLAFSHLLLPASSMLPDKRGSEKVCQVFVLRRYIPLWFLMSSPKYTYFMPQKPKNALSPLNLGNKTLGQRIAEARRFRGFTQIELAKKIGITQKLVTDYETGRTNMNAEMLARFSIAISVPADKLLGLDSSSKGDNTKSYSIRYMRRVREIDKLPEIKRRAILKTIDDLIRANS